MPGRAFGADPPDQLPVLSPAGKPNRPQMLVPVRRLGIDAGRAEASESPAAAATLLPWGRRRLWALRGADIHNSLQGLGVPQSDPAAQTDCGTGAERARAGDPTAAPSPSHPRLPAASAGRSARSTARHAATSPGARSRRCHRSACGSTSASISRLTSSTSPASQPPTQSLQLARTAATARLAQWATSSSGTPPVAACNVLGGHELVLQI